MRHNNEKTAEEIAGNLRYQAGNSSWPVVVFIHSGYLYSATSSQLLLRRAPDYNVDTKSELTRRRATGNCEWRTCPRSLNGGQSSIRTCDPPDAIHLAYHYATTAHGGDDL